MIKRVIIFSFALLISAGGYSQTMKGDNDIYMSDPIEPINRWVWDFNYYVLDAHIYKPVTEAYVDWVPKVGREALYNATRNLDEPVNFVNNLLQLEFKGATDSLLRFGLNSTFGLFGLFDIAKLGGVERRTETFGDVLGTWSVPQGPYLMLPVLGPRSTRNLVGNVVDSLYFPSSYLTLWQSSIVWGINGVSVRESFLGQEILIDQSLDSYTFVKEAYIQNELFRENGGHNNIKLPSETSKSIDQKKEDDISDFINEID